MYRSVTLRLRGAKLEKASTDENIMEPQLAEKEEDMKNISSHGRLVVSLVCPHFWPYFVQLINTEDDQLDDLLCTMSDTLDTNNRASLQASALFQTEQTPMHSSY